MKISCKKKIFVFIFIFAFMVLYSPRLVADTPNPGKIVGFLYKADRTSPFEKAIIEARNIATGSVYQSTTSDVFGAFKIEVLESGLYLVGIRTEKGNFTVSSLIGVREDITTTVALALELRGREKSETVAVGTAEVIASSDPVVYSSVFAAGEVPGNPPVETPADPPADPPGPPADVPPGPPDDPPGKGKPPNPPGPPGDPPEPDPSPSSPGNPGKK